MLKLLGATLTILSCGYTGFLWAAVFEKRPRELRTLESALQILESEIMYGATPMIEAMDSVAKRVDKPINMIFARTEVELGKMEGVTAGEAWQRSIEVVKPQTCLIEKDISILKRLGAALGGSDREDQGKHFKLARDQIASMATAAEGIALKNARMYKSLGLLGGLFLVLAIY